VTDNLLKKQAAIRVQQCVDSMADSIKILTNNCNELSKAVSEMEVTQGKLRENLKLLTINEVGKLLSVSRPQVYKLVYAGELDAVQLGKRCLRITESSVKSFLDENTVLPADIYGDGEV
jgi:excisionase family DNA binding protein